MRPRTISRPRILVLFALAALIGAAVAVLPALAAGTPAPSEVKLEINENCHLPEWPCWNVKGNNPEDIGQIQPFTIAQGGTISFEDNDSKAPTDVLWKGAAPSCTPEAPSTPKTSWSSTCTFTNAGEYEFESQELFNADGFNYTQYKVIVEKSGAPAQPPPRPPRLTNNHTDDHPHDAGRTQPGLRLAFGRRIKGAEARRQPARYPPCMGRSRCPRSAPARLGSRPAGSPPAPRWPRRSTRRRRASGGWCARR